MASASGIRMGKVFVEIGADPTKFFSAVQGLQKSIGRIGSSMQSLGTKMLGVGTAMAVPLGLAVRAGAKFETTLKNISASTGASAQDIQKVSAAAMQLSQSMGVGPTAIADGFLELLKAGMPLQAVLGGAGKAALEFAKVSEMAVGEAAVVMSDAMNVFGVDAASAANTLSAAADGSSTSIKDIAQAFTQVSAVASQSNQSIGDTAAALALMANAGVKGSDAGTSLKNMFAKLKSPVDGAAKALESVGLSTESFRDASGAMLPLADQITVLKNATDGLGQAARDDLFQRVFGSDAIRAALILTKQGADGINGMKQTMSEAMPVSQKFETLMGGLAGTGQKISASLERLQIAVTGALQPALEKVAAVVMGVINGLADFVRQNDEVVVGVARGVVQFTLVSGALYGLGKALTMVGTAFGLLLSPVGLFVAAIGTIAVSSGFASGAMSDLEATAQSVGGKIAEALASGDFAKAWIYAIAAVEEALLRMRKTFERTIQRPINFVATQMSEAPRFSEIMQGIHGGLGEGVRSDETNRQVQVAGQLNSARTAEQFAAARNSAAAEMRAAEMAGNASVAASFRELIQMVTERMTQLGVIGDTSLERDLADIRSRAEARVSALDEQRQSQRLAAERGGGITTVNPQLPTDAERASADQAWKELFANAPQTRDWQAEAKKRMDEQSKADAEAARIAEEARIAAESQSEAAGTFSAMAVGGMGFGSSIAQRQLDEQKETNKILRDKLGRDEVAA